MSKTAKKPSLDHDDFGSTVRVLAKIINLIDSHSLERNASGKPPRSPLRWSEKAARSAGRGLNDRRVAAARRFDEAPTRMAQAIPHRFLFWHHAIAGRNQHVPGMLLQRLSNSGMPSRYPSSTATRLGYLSPDTNNVLSI
jgi:hypothetical protein